MDTIGFLEVEVLKVLHLLLKFLISAHRSLVFLVLSVSNRYKLRFFKHVQGTFSDIQNIFFRNCASGRKGKR